MFVVEVVVVVMVVIVLEAVDFVVVDVWWRWFVMVSFTVKRFTSGH